MTEVAPPLVDFSPIGGLYDAYKQARQQAARDAALNQFAQKGTQFDQNTRNLIAADPQVGMGLAALIQRDNQRQSALKLSESFGGMFGGQPASPAAPVNSPGIESGPDQRLPRGIRNNNPLNIEAGDFTQRQPGYSGSDGRFARFASADQGMAATNALLDSYQNKQGLNTVRGIIGRWAPQGENDTNGYVASVAGRMGVSPDQPLGPEHRQALIAAMGQFENGRPIQQAASRPMAMADGQPVTGADGGIMPSQFENGRPLSSQAAAVAPAAGASTSSTPQAATPWPAAPQAGNPQAPQATLGGKSMDQWLPMMMRIATHPDAPPEVQKVAIEFVKGAQAEAGLTKEQKEYRYYVQQGGKDDFTTWDRKNKTAGATLINTAEGETAAQSKARIAIDTHAIADLSKKAVAGRSALPLLDQVMRLADKTPGGWAGQASPMLARAFSGLGLPVTEGMSNAELLASVSRQFIPSVRDPGSTSNYEQQLYQTAVPGLAQSVEGRQKVARMFKAQIERNNEILQIYRQNIGSADLDKKLSELDAKPIFVPEDRKVLEQYAQAPQEEPAAAANPYEAEMRKRGLLK